MPYTVQWLASCQTSLIMFITPTFSHPGLYALRCLIMVITPHTVLCQHCHFAHIFHRGRHALPCLINVPNCLSMVITSHSVSSWSSRHTLSHNGHHVIEHCLITIIKPTVSQDGHHAMHCLMKVIIPYTVSSLSSWPTLSHHGHHPYTVPSWFFRQYIVSPRSSCNTLSHHDHHATHCLILVIIPHTVMVIMQ